MKSSNRKQQNRQNCKKPNEKYNCKNYMPKKMCEVGMESMHYVGFYIVLMMGKMNRDSPNHEMYHLLQ